MSTRAKVVVMALVLLAACAIGYRIYSGGGLRLDQSSFYQAVVDGQVEQITISGDGIGYAVRGTLHPDQSFTTYVLDDRDLTRMLRQKGVSVKAENPERGALLANLVPWMIAVLVLGVCVFFLMRHLRSGSNPLLSLRGSRGKLSASGRKVTFADVAGMEEVKQELLEIIEFLAEPKKFQRLGGKIPTGVLLIGPTGTGKTLIARAVAGEAGVPFFSISGSDFVEMFVGIGASRVRSLFEQGKKSAPCIIFIDEIDAVGRQRGAGVGSGNDEREQTLNQLLVELDGFSSHEGVIVIAATNRPDVLDPALLRPGRFDRQVIVDRPDVRGREEIINVHVRKVPLDADVELGLIARGTPGFSGADLANLVNEAALYAAVHGRQTVTHDDLERARDKVLMGAERRSLVLSEEERHGMAYHQAGHAVMAHLLPGADPLHKVTLVPRGRNLGTVQQLPVDDRHTASRDYLLATIGVLMGGRVAEELRLDRLSSGSAEDFERATDLGRKMVTRWGMSESLGPVTYGHQNEQIFLGREMGDHRDFSDATAGEIDREVKSIVMGCYERARRVLGERLEALTRVAEALLAHETLDAGQIAALVEGQPLTFSP